jgi:hypothetical protein
MRTRTKTTLIIIATLVIGIFIGALGSGFVVQRSARHFGERKHREIFIDRVVEVIDPTPDQERVVRAILTKHSEQFEEMSDRFRLEAAALFDSLKADLDTVLTEEQKARLQERVEKMPRPMRHPRPPRGGPDEKLPPPPPPGD